MITSPQPLDASAEPINSALVPGGATKFQVNHSFGLDTAPINDQDFSQGKKQHLLGKGKMKFYDE